MSTVDLNAPDSVSTPRVSVASPITPRPSLPSFSPAPSSIAPTTKRDTVPSSSSSSSLAQGDGAAVEVAAARARELCRRLECEREARIHAEDRALRHADAAQRACEARDSATADAVQLLRQRDRYRKRVVEAEAAAEERAVEREADAWELGAAAEREARVRALCISLLCSSR